MELSKDALENNPVLKEIVKEVVKDHLKPELDQMKETNTYLQEGNQFLNE